MQRLSLALFVLATFCAFIGVGYAHSSTGNEKLYKSAGPWSLLVGSCELKVRSVGSAFFFQPIGNSNTEFLGEMPSKDNAAVPVDLSWSKITPAGTIHEVLHLEFTVDNTGAIQPAAYHLSRSISLDGVEKQNFETNCGDLR